ncbi:unnamed protein product, partial [Owenia fusiformis]
TQLMLIADIFLFKKMQGNNHSHTKMRVLLAILVLLVANAYSNETSTSGKNNFEMTTNIDGTLELASDKVTAKHMDSNAAADELTMNATEYPAEATTEEEIIYIRVTDFPEYHQARLLWKVGSPILLIIGLTGNVLSITVLTATRMRKTTSSFYLTFLAVCDCLVLICGLGRQWGIYQWGKDIRYLHPWACKLSLFLTYTFIDISAWLLVAVTIDRAITVYKPLHARRISTKKNASIAITIIVILIIGINAQQLFNYGPVTLPWYDTFYVDKCTYKDNEIFHQDVWPWIDSIVASYLPFLVLIMSNILIVTQLVRSSNMRKKTMNVSKQAGDSTKSMSIMLVVISIVFLLLTCPVVIYLASRNLWYDRFPGSVAKQRLVWACLNMLLYSNYCINFFMYCLSGQRFRTEMMILFRCKSRVKKGHQQTISATTSSTMTSSTSIATTASSEPKPNNKL